MAMSYQSSLEHSSIAAGRIGREGSLDEAEDLNGKGKVPFACRTEMRLLPRENRNRARQPPPLKIPYPQLANGTRQSQAF